MTEASANPAGISRFVPILAVQFIGTLGYSIAIPFLVFLVTDFGGVAWTYGLIGAAYSACQLVGAPILGRWSDRAGRRPVLIASQAGTLVAWLIFLVALSLPKDSLGSIAGATITVPLVLIFAARALDGLTGGNMSVASAFVADLTQNDPAGRSVAFGQMGMAASLGFALGPAVAGLLGEIGDGYTAPVAAAAAISAVALVACFVLLKEPPSRCPEGPDQPPAVAQVLGQQHKRCDRVEPVATQATLRRPIVVALLTATFVQFLSFNLFYAGFPVHSTTVLGWDAGRLGLFFTLMSAVMIVTQGPLLSFASKRVAPPTLFVLGMLGLVASFIAFAIDVPGAPFAGAVLFSIGNGLAWPTFQARLADAVGPEDQGTVQGAATSAGALASIFGLIVGGILYPLLDVWLFIAGAALFILVAAGTPVWFRSSSSTP